MNENIFRILAALILFTGMGISIYFRRKADRDSGEKLSELRVDGGAAANDLLMQFQADILGVPVVRPKVLETTALGAAYLAGLYTDVWKSPEEIAAQWQMDRRFTPQMAREELVWRMHFMFGTLAYTLAATDTVQLIAGCKPEDRHDAKLLEDRLTAFLAAGLTAPLKNAVRKAA